MKRSRGCSSSSNETILEACSSSPSIHNPGHVDAAHSPFPLLDPSIGPPPRRLTAGPKSPAKTDNGYHGAKGRTAPSDMEYAIKGNNADGDDDSEESIDWDDDSDGDTHNSTPEPRRVVKRAKLPQTIGFHVDWWIARIATAAVNLDFKVLCASMMLWREKNEVFQVPTYCMRPSPQTTWSEGNVVSDTASSQIPRSPSPVPLPPRRVDQSSVPMLDWDVLLEDIRLASEQMHQDRKWRIRGKKNAAGWCKWGARQRIMQRGKFVEETEVRYELEREADGRTWVIGLGYRRDVAGPEDMDVDGERAGADDAVASQQGAGGTEETEGTLNRPASNDGKGLDVVMEAALDP